MVKRVIVRRIRNNRQRAPVPNGQSNGIKLLNDDIARRFNPHMLELGDISAPCQEKEAVAAVFDLTGFTSFCNQVDAYLAIPRFLNDFLEWFFAGIREALTEENDGTRSTFWAELPVLVKFLGDGLLVLWEAHRMTEEQICRLAATLYYVCYSYRQDFYPQMSMIVNKPPRVLRCGVARGKVFSVGNGNDYIGHCINNASRLSHLGSITFSFPHRGFRVREYMPENYARLFIPKCIAIKGVGENEQVWVAREEYERLQEKDRAQYRAPENAAALA
jgi:class 3 adenylate cyclase